MAFLHSGEEMAARFSRYPGAVQRAALLGLECAFDLKFATLCCAPAGGGRQWLAWTSAMAAGLTDYSWTLRHLLYYRVPPPAWVPRRAAGSPPSSSKCFRGRWQPDHGSVQCHPLAFGAWYSTDWPPPFPVGHSTTRMSYCWPREGP